ncbi:sialidase family protein [Membranihabitans maritimus]|uniref:sialidase family protein n=1 Tax=Membranihabitans maritimus TaxID=2904244 RepID=UPI001F30E2C1|nr:sialidase family protein [Membranihabitans maritimus]
MKSTINITQIKNGNKYPILYFSLCLISILLVSCAESKDDKKETSSGEIEHGIVFYEEGKFAGWPANNGMWNWDDEVLMGFVVSDHKDSDGAHTYDSKAARHKYARSMDGGKTWKITDAYDIGQKGWAYDHYIDGEEVAPEELKEGVKDFTDPDFLITFQRHNNNDGPTHFYYSQNRGNDWKGPYWFPNLGTDGVASRTDYLVNGKQDLFAFLTVAKSNKKEGRVVLSRTRDGGVSWELVSWVGPEPGKFEIMPSSVRLGSSELLTVIRARSVDGKSSLSSYISTDNGDSWEKLENPVEDTGEGGSPPALVKMNDGRLALGYIYRSTEGSRVNVKFSKDKGRTWGKEIVLREGDGATRDVGYPQMIQRPDGKLLMTYYWNNALQKPDAPYRYIASTIFDPED